MPNISTSPWGEFVVLKTAPHAYDYITSGGSINDLRERERALAVPCFWGRKSHSNQTLLAVAR